MTLDYPVLIDYESEAARPNMTDVQNWNPQEGALAFGAGVTVGTLADNGFTAKAKVIFAIMIPGPVILIEGYGKILSFDNAYPFRVLAVLDVPSGTFLMNIGSRTPFRRHPVICFQSTDRPKPSSPQVISVIGIFTWARINPNPNACRRMCSASSPPKPISWSIRMVWPWAYGLVIHSTRNTVFCESS